MNNLQHDIKFILDLIKKKNFLAVKSRLDEKTLKTRLTNLKLS